MLSKKNKYLRRVKISKATFYKKENKPKYLYKVIIIICVLIIISDYYFVLKNGILDKNNKLRKKMFERLSIITNRTIISLGNVYLGHHYKLGNSLISINKVIYYCEILQCKRIILNQNLSEYIKNTIYDKKYNLIIEPEAKLNKNLSNVFHWPKPYYTVLYKNPENRFDVFKDEIIKNLPKVSTDINDLYIHIRNGDVYKNPLLGRFYAQPPLCFYKKVIESKTFNSIFIVAEDDDYPIIKKLLEEFKNVKYNRDSIQIDASKLIYAYNIVGSISSFLTSLIKLNDNLKYFWEYDLYHKATKINHLHYSISNFTRKYTIYSMAPSKIYKENMYYWNRTKEQLDLMINDTCPNDFVIIKPNLS